MSTFESKLKAKFYNSGEMMSLVGARVCLLDNTGNVIGSDTLENVSKKIFTKDDVVDMGLPSGTLWGRKNVGAIAETDYGWYFSWGNTDGHQGGSGYNFNAATYQETSGYAIDGNLILENDAARANLGGLWHMPSTEQFVELLNPLYTSYEWVEDYKGISGANGIVIKSYINGNELFFPAAGKSIATSNVDKDTNGYYWTLSYSTELETSAFGMEFDALLIYDQSLPTRAYGLTIRPVI